MDAIKLLKDDHRRVEALFAEFEKLGKRAKKTKERVVRQILDELKLHAHLEETIFYPALREAIEDEDVVLEGFEEHPVVKHVMGDLEAIDADHVRFDVRVKVLKELVEHHVEEEEKEMLPEARKALGKARLEELGERMAAAKAAGPVTENLRVTLHRELPVEDRVETRRDRR